MLLVMAAACSNDSKTTKLMELIPADADLVAVGNLKTIVESAGGSIDGSQITLPSYITDKMSENDTKEYQEATSLLGKSGVDVDACAIAGYFKEEQGYFIAMLNDKDMFVKAIEGEEFKMSETDNGITFYVKQTSDSDNNQYDKFCYCAIKDDCVIGTFDISGKDQTKATTGIKTMIEKAGKQSFASTSFSEYITSGNALGLAVRMPKELQETVKQSALPADMMSIYEGVICMKSDLTSNEAKMSWKFFDKEGKELDTTPFEQYANLDAKISADAMSYMGPDEFFVYAVCLKDVNWDKYLETVATATKMSASDKMTITMAKSYLEKFNGTIALGLGVKNGMQSITSMQKGLEGVNEASMTVVCETQDGKAADLMNEAKGLLDMFGMPYESDGNKLSMTIPGGYGTVYLEANGNVLILANHEIKKGSNPVVKHVDFDDNIFATGIFLGKDNQLAKDFGIQEDIKMAITGDSKSMESTMTLEIGGDSSTGVIEKFAKVIPQIIEAGKKISM